MANNLTSPTPQFGTAEYASAADSDRCKSCNQTFGSTYYRVNGAVTCSYCTEQLKMRMPVDSHSAFVRALIFGVCGAVLGLVLYAGFGILTGLMVGYVSLAVGFIVGKAMMKGSNGIGGRRYQIAALALTYAAVSMAAIPIGISQYIKQQKEQKQGLVKHAAPGRAASPQSSPAVSTPESLPEQASVESPSSEATKPGPGDAAGPAATRKGKANLGAAFGMLALLGLASPFLELQDPVHGIIGLVILLVGIRIAWRITADTKIDILGPFNKTAAKPATS